MPLFQYVAINGQGDEVRGHLDAPDPRSAAAQLREQTLFVVELLVSAKAAVIGDDQPLDHHQSVPGARLSLSMFLPVTTQDRMFFLRQLALMLRTGLTLLESLEACRDQARKQRLATGIEQMIVAIHTGRSLSQAMSDQRSLLSKVTIKLVESAESSGEMDATLEQAAVNLERQLELKAKLITALIYPSVIVLTAIGISVFLVVKVIPKFASFLARRDLNLPWTTRMLLDLSSFVTTYGLFILFALFGTALALGIAFVTRRGRVVLDRGLVALPYIGSLLTTAAMIQFTRTLAVLLNSGLTLIESLRVASNVVGNRAIAAHLDHTSDTILIGQNLSGSLEHRLIPSLVIQIVTVGERTGTLSIVLQELSQFYDQQLQARLGRMVALMEPAMILVVGGMVFFVYLSFFQVIFQLAGGGRH